MGSNPTLSATRPRSATPYEPGCSGEAAGVLSVALVGLGGAIGSVMRYGLALWAMPYSRQLPLGTIGINVLGSFAISFFGTLTLAHGRFAVAEPVRLFVMVGICGGFTTFSAFSLQTLDMLRGGMLARAMANVALSVLLCLASVALGHVAASGLNNAAPGVAQTAVEEETG